ncbi:MAG TPA: outer membrane beta-barrel protein [Chitinophagaceae bacterium]|nr:outer membrane beta-barrel protein [Chitinophagaceae bacterium]
MQENSFEKQVQQKMGELSFTPSAPVWQNVQAQIKKRKERKRIIFWMFPLLAVTTGFFWLGINSISNKPKPSVGNHSMPSANGNSDHRVTAPVPEDAKGISVPNKPVDLPSSTIDISASKPKFSIVEEVILPTNTPRTGISSSVLEAPNAIGVTGSHRANSTNQTSAEEGTQVLKEESDNDKNVNVATIYDIDSVSNKSSTREKDSAGKDPETVLEKLVAQVPKKPGAAKWKIGFHTAAGRSGLKNGLLASLGAKAAQEANFQSGFPGGVSNGGVFNSPPSKPQRGLALSIGLSAKHILRKKSNIVTGLYYSYYSTRLPVGTAVSNQTLYLDNNSALATRFYQNDSAKSMHINKYHYIELPLGIEYQVLRKVPVYVQHGVAFGYLFFSNAVDYNSRANVYFRDQDALRKMNIQLFSSISYNIVNHNKFVWSAGPQVQYGILGLHKKTSDSPEHLFSFGIKSGISF